MGGICLGNLSVDDFIRRTGYNISDEDRKILESHRQDNADIKFNSNKFHIFDVPFSITVGEEFCTELVTILKKYEEITPSKECCNISVVKETEQERERRLKREKEQQEWNEKLTNPNSVWNVKWHMLVPVNVNGHEIYYGCFINTYTTGRNNIPNIINGNAWIKLTEEGLFGRFVLDNPEKDNDAEKDNDYNYVIGTGFVKLSGTWIGNVEGAYFEETNFNIAEAIQNRKNIKDGDFYEIHYASAYYNK